VKMMIKKFLSIFVGGLAAIFGSNEPVLRSRSLIHKAKVTDIGDMRDRRVTLWGIQGNQTPLVTNTKQRAERIARGASIFFEFCFNCLKYRGNPFWTTISFVCWKNWIKIVQISCQIQIVRFELKMKTIQHFQQQFSSFFFTCAVTLWLGDPRLLDAEWS